MYLGQAASIFTAADIGTSPSSDCNPSSAGVFDKIWENQYHFMSNAKRKWFGTARMTYFYSDI